MVSLSTVLVAIISAGAANATMMLQARDTACGEGQGEVVTQHTHTCCPGVVKHDNSTVLCCYGGSQGGCGQTNCDHDLSTCQHTFNIDDPNYAENVMEALNITVRVPNSSPHDTPMLGMVVGLAAVVAAMGVS
ncbi:hypothetical protein Hte_000492 [Hypoxylon texense]